MAYIYIICRICGTRGKKCSKRSQFLDLCSPCAQKASKLKYAKIHQRELLDARYAWRKTHPEEYLASRRSLYAKNPEPHRKRSRDWNKAHPEEQRKKCHDWNVANPEPARKRSLEWQKVYPGKANARNHKRRARVKGVPGDFTDEEFQMKVDSQNGLCFDCKKPFDNTKTGRVTRGHLIPVSQPGSTNDISNLVAQCQSCNSKQYTKIHPSVTYLVEPTF